MFSIEMYLFLAFVIFIINTFPSFMPPTWTILLFFYLKYDFIFIPTVIIGAIFATLGRVVLYHLSKRYFRRFLSKKSEEEMGALGKYFNTHTHVTIPLVLTYAFLPIPSNQVYLAAGLAKVNIKLLAFSFLIGRLMSYSLWVGGSYAVADNLKEIFTQQYSKIGTFVIDLSGFIFLYLLTKVNWRKILSKISKSDL